MSKLDCRSFVFVAPAVALLVVLFPIVIWQLIADISLKNAAKHGDEPLKNTTKSFQMVHEQYAMLNSSTVIPADFVLGDIDSDDEDIEGSGEEKSDIEYEYSSESPDENYDDDEDDSDESKEKKKKKKKKKKPRKSKESDKSGKTKPKGSAKDEPLPPKKTVIEAEIPGSHRQGPVLDEKPPLQSREPLLPEKVAGESEIAGSLGKEPVLDEVVSSHHNGEPPSPKKAGDEILMPRPRGKEPPLGDPAFWRRLEDLKLIKPGEYLKYRSMDPEIFKTKQFEAPSFHFDFSKEFKNLHIQMPKVRVPKVRFSFPRIKFG